MNFVVRTQNDRFFGPFSQSQDAVDWATKYLPPTTQWVIVPVWGLISVDHA